MSSMPGLAAAYRTRTSPLAVMGDPWTPGLMSSAEVWASTQSSVTKARLVLVLRSAPMAQTLVIRAVTVVRMSKFG
ncbi:MAG: hypothetical protein KME20_27725 [Kaiparowitsia implicata GSE-PSE-MK54-09C]|nr:hypothetical protein [Kaiparowitsia implicata GSE-PSE-MK54-09C]